MKKDYEELKTKTPRNDSQRPPLIRTEAKRNRKIYDGIRSSGIPEKETEDSTERHEHDLTEVNNLFSFLSVDAAIIDFKRLGKQHRTKTSNDHS